MPRSLSATQRFAAIRPGDRLAVIAVIERKMLRKRIRQHLIHINGNSLHA